jgi:hypothetical protein
MLSGHMTLVELTNRIYQTLDTLVSDDLPLTLYRKMHSP